MMGIHDEKYGLKFGKQRKIINFCLMIIIINILTLIALYFILFYWKEKNRRVAFGNYLRHKHILEKNLETHIVFELRYITFLFPKFTIDP